ncbi:GxxExxY protein [Mariniflexile sp. HMF6888]|uniref:GxxExxY protein n=1 Tax=Mariniflexile sp. HMF6888 TaxID=3373086 RepID=UPI0037971DFB
MEDKLTGEIIGAAIEVHKNLGPGLLESAYRNCLHYELTEMGYSVKKEVTQPIIYKDIKLDHGYRIDLLVENLIVIESKTVKKRDKKIHKRYRLTLCETLFPCESLCNNS